MKIDEGTRYASVEEDKIMNLLVIIFFELAITLVVSCCILSSLQKEIKKSIDKTNTIKTYNKNIEETNFTLMNLLNKSADNIAKCNDLCRKLTELLETSEMTKKKQIF